MLSLTYVEAIAAVVTTRDQACQEAEYAEHCRQCDEEWAAEALADAVRDAEWRAEEARRQEQWDRDEAEYWDWVQSGEPTIRVTIPQCFGCGVPVACRVVVKCRDCADYEAAQARAAAYRAEQDRLDVEYREQTRQLAADEADEVRWLDAMAGTDGDEGYW